jgi:hypothetical protein
LELTIIIDPPPVFITNKYEREWHRFCLIWSSGSRSEKGEPLEAAEKNFCLKERKY